MVTRNCERKKGDAEKGKTGTESTEKVRKPTAESKRNSMGRANKRKTLSGERIMWLQKKPVLDRMDKSPQATERFVQEATRHTITEN